MKIAKASIAPIDYFGLRIVDYTSGGKLSSSVAEITIDPGTSHPKAYSKRSDKYYYVVSGNLEFTIENDSYSLAPGDVCIIVKGQRFSYRNATGDMAKVVLVHTPEFDVQSEVLEE
jgi:quercetin dioxygenase-like cupin family protein